MSWPTHVNLNVPKTLYSRSDTELEDWRGSFLKQSEAFPLSSSPKLSVTAPVAESRSYNNRIHLPPAPVAFGSLSSHTLSSASSAFFDPTTANGYIDEINQVPTSAGIGIELSSTSLYDPRCLSPWTDVTSSPAPPSDYPNLNTIKNSLNENVPISTPIPGIGGALTLASLYDPKVSSPRMDVRPSPVSGGDTSCTSKVRKEPSPSKQPCRSRRRTSKKKLVCFSTLCSIGLHFLTRFRPVKTQITVPTNAITRTVLMVVCFPGKEC
jgi:hypothetical protein